jgi:hypothetical protein
MALRRTLLALEGKHDWLEWLVLRAKKLLGEDGVVEEDEFENVMNAEASGGVNGASGSGSGDGSGGGSGSGSGGGGADTVSPAKSRWNKAILTTQTQNKENNKLKRWQHALTAARDSSMPMEARAEKAARAAKKADELFLPISGTRSVASKKAAWAGTVGAVLSYRPQDYNLDILREKLRESIMQREDTADAIAACAQKGYPIVNAWVTFSEEQLCLDCIALVGGSKRGLTGRAVQLQNPVDP